jgi:hypothetical protein
MKIPLLPEIKNYSDTIQNNTARTSATIAEGIAAKKWTRHKNEDQSHDEIKITEESIELIGKENLECNARCNKNP